MKTVLHRRSRLNPLIYFFQVSSFESKRSNRRKKALKIIIRMDTLEYLFRYLVSSISRMSDNSENTESFGAMIICDQ